MTAPPVLRITEILATLNGESRWAGLPCALVRLTGCPLRCRWCDATHAHEGGELLEGTEVLTRIRALGLRRVLVTGGEPLAQAHCLGLLQALVDEGHEVLLETSGALPVGAVPAAVHRIVDVKPPSSGEAARMRLDNLALLGLDDEVKFVVADRSDFDAALQVIQAHGLVGRTGILVSPVHDELAPIVVARWILDAGLDTRLNLQLHKLAFGAAGDAALVQVRGRDQS
ncbi:MAG: radical SAM protein [Pseudomonadota bacterium]